MRMLERRLIIKEALSKEVEVEIEDKNKFLSEIKTLTSSNEFYIHKDDDGEIALNTSLIQAIEFTEDDENKRGAGLVSSD